MRLNRISSIGSRFRPYAAFALVALALWLAIAFALHYAEREAMEKANAEGRNLARSLAEHVASSVRAIDLVLLHLRAEWSEGSLRFADHVARQQQYLKPEFLAQVTVLEADGRVVYSNTPALQRANLSDRPYFKAQKERGTDALYVSAPLRSQLTGNWIILFTRPILDREGRFAGLLALSMPPPALERVYNDIELGEGAAIALVRNDGQILAHSRDLATAASVSLAEAPGLSPDAGPTGEFRRVAKTDGMERLYRYQKVRGYPMTVFVGQATDTVLAPYRAQRTTYLVSGAAATALLLAVMLLLVSRRGDKEEADRHRAGLEAGVRKSEQHLRLLFDAFPLAVTLVDKTQRIVFANRLYRRNFGSDPAGHTVRELVGDKVYAELAPYIERVLAGEEVQFERAYTNKAGEIRIQWRRYVPDRDVSGEIIGFVGLREDITERRRAEEKIQQLNEELERRVAERTSELTAAIAALHGEVNERRQAETAALDLAKRVQSMARRLGEAQEVERRRLAAELHDGVSSNLAAIGLNLVLLQKQLPQGDVAGLERRLSDLIGLIDEAKANAKDISVDLRPLLLEERDLLSALEDYAHKFEGSTGIAAAVRGADSGRRLPAEEKIALFRITQEALTNCAKHANAKAVAIELNIGADHLILSIADDGVGIDLSGLNGKTHGLGLLSMQERAEAIGGIWSIDSTPGEGTRVLVRVEAAGA